MTAIVLGAAVLAAAACGGDGDRVVTVFAAASLTDAFDEIADAFESSEPGVQVELNFAGSSSLREQIVEGAPADVYASANTSNMDLLAEADAVGAPEVFATNRLAIAVADGNPEGIQGLDDFADEGRFIGLCAEPVPCGTFGDEVLRRAGVTPAPDTREPDVRALLTKIRAGELDAGLVYVTDIRGDDDAVDGVEVPADVNVVASYPIATVDESGDAETARAFVDFVLGPEGQAILRAAGFGPP